MSHAIIRTLDLNTNVNPAMLLMEYKMNNDTQGYQWLAYRGTPYELVLRVQIILSDNVLLKTSSGNVAKYINKHKTTNGILNSKLSAPIELGVVVGGEREWVSQGRQVQLFLEVIQNKRVVGRVELSNDILLTRKQFEDNKKKGVYRGYENLDFAPVQSSFNPDDVWEFVTEGSVSQSNALQLPINSDQNLLTFLNYFGLTCDIANNVLGVHLGNEVLEVMLGRHLETPTRYVYNTQRVRTLNPSYRRLLGFVLSGLVHKA